ncbi:hypothetical protein COLO4_33092 [Corchorus olitorius]|uniref:Uncharacterized protein n=1 Tax=Corchorus olitorius TaxID=93759 RepID=A0A1R3GWI2_9ROSI|nr:hypothetical protein COLO4_33092 [Corchorus olitorius]
MAFIAACYIVLLRDIIRLGPFIEYIWIDDAFEVGDVIMINNVEHEVVDFLLRGDFYLVCKEVATGNNVAMGSNYIMEATIRVGNVTYLGSL